MKIKVNAFIANCSSSKLVECVFNFRVMLVLITDSLFAFSSHLLSKKLFNLLVESKDVKLNLMTESKM